MASLVLTGDTSGQVTLAAPAVAGTTTLTLPATTGTVLNDATVGVCRAWVNFNGTLTTPITPRAAFNVGSVTKNATGDYTVNFTNAISDTNYATLASAGSGQPTNFNAFVAANASQSAAVAPTTTAMRFSTRNAANIATDFDYLFVAVFR